MPNLPEAVSEGFDNRKGAAILTTVAKDGTPNSVWVGCVSKYADDTLVVADNFFSKTRANIEAGCMASLLWLTEDGKSYQVKGAIERQTEGPIFDDMKDWLSPNLPGHAAAVITVEEVYSGADKLA